MLVSVVFWISAGNSTFFFFGKRCTVTQGLQGCGARAEHGTVADRAQKHGVSIPGGQKQ